MTSIRVRYVPPGSDESVAGWIRFVPRSFDPNSPIAEGPDVLVGDTGNIEIEPGMNTVEVRPTSSGWFYAVQGRAGRHTFTTNVLVPPSGEHDFESLVRVDPKAGGLEYEPDPEWRADLDSIRHLGSITSLATPEDPGLMSSEDKVKLDGFTQISSSLTVRIPSDYPTLQEAIDDLAPALVSRTETVSLEIEAGHAPSSGIIVRNGNFSSFVITSEDPAVTVSDSFTGSFIAGYSANMPQLATIIDMDDKGEDGYAARSGSTGIVAPFAGIRNAGGRGCYLNQDSRVSAAQSEFTGCNNRNVWISRASTFEGSEGNFSANKGGLRAVYVSRGSVANVFSADISNAVGDIALYVLRSFVCAQDVDVSGAQGDGICATTGSIVAARGVDATNCGFIGIRAMDGGAISADNADASGCGNAGFRASDGSSISARLATSNNCGADGFRAEDGSSIAARSAQAIDNASAGFRALYGSNINARNSVATGNASRDFLVIGGGQMSATGATGTTGSPITSVDTNVGQLNSYNESRGIIFV